MPDALPTELHVLVPDLPPEQHPDMKSAEPDHAGGKNSLTKDVCTSLAISGEVILRIAAGMQVTIA